MDFIKSWILNITMLVLLCSVIEMISPDDKFKKYINFILGLVVMISIINPFLNFSKSGFTLKYNLPSINTDKYNININDIKNKQNIMIENQYKQNLSLQIKNFIENKYNYIVQDVNINLSDANNDYGAMSKLTITIKAKNNIKPIKKVTINNKSSADADNSNDINLIKKDISYFYNLPVENISIIDK